MRAFDEERFPLLNQPRPLSAVHAGSAPGTDARWRNAEGVSKRRGRAQVANSLRVHDAQLAARA